MLRHDLPFHQVDIWQKKWHVASSVQFSHSVMSDSLWPHGLQHARLSCASPIPRACSNSCSSSRWCYPTISSFVIPFSSHPVSFPASGSFPMIQLFTTDGQGIGTSTSVSVFPINIQDWFPLGLTGWISLQSKGLSRVFSNTTVQKHQFFDAQLYGPTLTVCSNSCPLSQWCYPTISYSVGPFFSYLQSFPATASYPMSWLFTSGGQSIGVSAWVLPMSIQI